MKTRYVGAFKFKEIAENDGWIHSAAPEVDDRVTFPYHDRIDRLCSFKKVQTKSLINTGIVHAYGCFQFIGIELLIKIYEMTT